MDASIDRKWGDTDTAMGDVQPESRSIMIRKSVARVLMYLCHIHKSKMLFGRDSNQITFVLFK